MTTNQPNAHGAGHDEHAENADNAQPEIQEGVIETKNGFGLGAIVLVLVAVVILWLFIPKGSTLKWKSKDDSSQNTGQSISTNSDVPDHITFPPHKSIRGSITGDFGDVVEIDPGYLLTFVCTEPYQIMDGKGRTYDGEAGKSVILPTVYAEDDTSLLGLRFRTRNGTITSMKVVFSPMTIPNPAKKGGSHVTS